MLILAVEVPRRKDTVASMATVVAKKTSTKKPPSIKRASPIPRRVLNALELRQPVVGVFRHKNRPHYGVAYTDENGRRCSRAFSFAHGGDEAAAYAQAVKFRRKTLRAKARR